MSEIMSSTYMYCISLKRSFHIAFAHFFLKNELNALTAERGKM